MCVSVWVCESHIVDQQKWDRVLKIKFLTLTSDRISYSYSMKKNLLFSTSLCENCSTNLPDKLTILHWRLFPSYVYLFIQERFLFFRSLSLLVTESAMKEKWIVKFDAIKLPKSRHSDEPWLRLYYFMTFGVCCLCRYWPLPVGGSQIIEVDTTNWQKTLLHGILNL